MGREATLSLGGSMWSSYMTYLRGDERGGQQQGTEGEEREDRLVKWHFGKKHNFGPTFFPQ